MAKYCSECGVELTEGAKFCGNCGASVNTIDRISKSQQVSVENQGVRTIKQPTEFNLYVETHQRKEPTNMAVIKIVFGVLSIALSMIALFQSCAVGVLGSLAKSNNGEGFTGILVAIITLTVGIVSIATRKHKGGNIAIIILCIIGCLVGFGMRNEFGDLAVYSWWLIIVAAISAVCLSLWKERR